MSELTSSHSPPSSDNDSEDVYYSASAEESDDVERKQKQFKPQRKAVVSREGLTCETTQGHTKSPESSDSNEELQDETSPFTGSPDHSEHPNFTPYLRPFTKNESGSDNDSVACVLDPEKYELKRRLEEKDKTIKQLLDNKMKLTVRVHLLEEKVKRLENRRQPTNAHNNMIGHPITKECGRR